MNNIYRGKAISNYFNKRSLVIARGFILVMLLLAGTQIQAQIYQHNFGTSTISDFPYIVSPTATPTPGIIDPNLSNSSWTNSTGAWTSFNGSGGAPSQAIALSNSSGTPTITLTLTIAPGYQANITSFSFWRQRSTTGAQAWSMTINGIAVGSGTAGTGGGATGTINVSNAVSNQTGTLTVVLSLSGATGTGTFRLDDFTLNGSVVLGPTLAASALTGFGNVCTNTTPGSNLFTVTGTNLTATNVQVGPLAGYTFSTDNATFNASVSFSLPGNQNRNIYVRFTPTLVQSYNGNIPVSGGGATAITVPVTGSGVNTRPTVTNGTVGGISTAGATISATISAIGCTAITGYGIEYSTTPGFPNGSGTQVPSSNLSGGNFSVILAALAPPGQTFYFHTYAANGGGTTYGTEGSFTLLNTVPTITVPAAGAGSLAGFGNVCVNTSSTQTFSLSGNLLNGSAITVGPLNGFTFATSLSGTYINSLTLTTAGTDYSYTGAALSGCTIYVKFIPTLIQSYNGNIPISGGGATSINVAASGSGINTPPSVTTNAAIFITTSSATLPGIMVSEGCGVLTDYGFEYSTAPFAAGTGTVLASGNLSGTSFSANLSSLTPNTTYYYYAYATNSGGTTYGVQSSFTTFGVPTKLVVISVSPASPTALTPFSITVQAQDNAGNPVDVSAETDIQLNQVAGSGVFSFPNAPLEAGTIFDGTNTVVITNLSYNIVENNVSLSATALTGMTGLGTSLPIVFNVVAYSGPSNFIWSNAGGSTWLTGSNWQTGTAPGSTTTVVNNSHLASFTSLANLSTLAVGGCGINMNTAGGNLNVGAIYFAETYNFSHVSDIVPIGNNSTTASGTLNLWGTALNTVGGISGNNYSSLLLANYMTGTTTKTLEVRNTAAGGTGSMTLNIAAAGSIVAGVGRTINLSTYMTGNQAITFTGGGNFFMSPSGVSSINAFTGAINVANGILSIGNSGAFNNAAPNVVTLGSTSNAGVLRLNGSSATIGGLATSGTAGNFNIVDNGNASATLTVNNTANYNFSGALNNGSSGTLSLVKSGTGSLTLAGLSQYTGTTTINAGTLRLNNAGGGTIPSGNSITMAGGTLRISADQTISNLTISAGTLQVDAGVTLTITGTYNPGPGAVTIVNNGTIRMQGNAPQSFPGTTATVTSMNNLTISNLFGVSMNKSLNIAGVLTLTSGTFTVGANTLTINNPIAGTLNNLSADQTSSIVIAGTVANVNLPSSVTQLNNFTVSNSIGTTLLGNLNVKTAVVISAAAGKVSTGLFTFNGTANLTMAGGNLYMEKNGVVLPEFNGVYTLTGGTVTFAGVGIASDAQTIRPVNYFNLASDIDGARILSSTGTIGVSNNFIPSTSPYTNAYTITGSTVDFNKAANGQTIPAFTFYTIRFSGGSFTKTLAGNINVVSNLVMASNTKLALSNFNVTLKSSLNMTASVDAVPTVNSFTYSGTGRFVVERYIATGAGHAKGWQLLAAPTVGQTIKQAWQEGAASSAANPNPGYGIQITSDLANATSLGFDIATPAGTGPGMKTYNASTNSWTGVPNTNSLAIANTKGYMVFVRGDRSVTTSAQAAVPVILRTTGKIYSPGTDAPASIPVSAGKFESVGNPYPSAIDFTNLLTTSTGLDSKFYIWDPLLYGTYGYGGFQTISSSNLYKPTPGGTINFPSNTPVTTIQSGQAFFVYSTPGGTASFAESNKSGGSRMTFRQGSTDNRASVQSYLYSSTGNLVDGNLVIVDPAFDNAIDADDALKFSNFGEGFGIRENQSTLTIDARRDITAADTVFFQLQNLRTQTYQVRILFNQFEGMSLEPMLVDRFTGQKTSLRISDTNRIDFTVTSDPDSRSVSRFYMIFKNLRPVPVSHIDITARRTGKSSVSVRWTAAQEQSVTEYRVERSSDGFSFGPIQTTLPRLNDGSTLEYMHEDKNATGEVLFYRIRVVSINGQEQLSPTVRVLQGKQMPGMDIITNPVTNSIITLQYHDMASGKWQASLMNTAGQLMWKGFVNTGNGVGQLSIRLPQNLPAGVYSLLMTNESGGKWSGSVSIQQ